VARAALCRDADDSNMPLKDAALVGFSGARGAGVMLLVAAVCGYVLVALPRTAIPTDTPALQCSHDAVAAVLTRDRALAKQAPTSPAGLALDSLLLERGQVERDVSETSETQALRVERIARAMEALRSASDHTAVLKLRALAVERMQDALDLTLPAEQMQGVLGGFPTILREAMASRDGELVAPKIVVRTLYKVRWNVIMGLPQLFALERVEHVAYNGWFALHATNGPVDARLTVLKAYEAAGGLYADEARGALGYAGGDPAGALRALQRAVAARPSFRLRNWMRAAERAAYTMSHKSDAP